METENNSLYPLITDNKFNQKLLSKSEFDHFKYDIPDYIHNRDIMKVLSNEACNKSSGYIYKQIQLLVSQYIVVRLFLEILAIQYQP